MPTARTIARATAVAGTLDLISAFVFGAVAGRSPVQVLRGVASGPFGNPAPLAGYAVATAGLVVHFAIMSVMAAAFVFATRRLPELVRRPVAAGLAYGVLLYLVMYWIVLPWRWPALFPQTGVYQVANALFSHCICVGLPIALIARAGLREGAVPSRS